MWATIAGVIMCMLIVPHLASSMENLKRCQACNSPNFIPTSKWAVKTCAQLRGELPGMETCGSRTMCRRWACADCSVEEWKRNVNTVFCVLHPSPPESFFVGRQAHPNAGYGGLNEDPARGKESDTSNP
ncbi:hypothetical protein PGT21_025566 [Puccinia graminis f. sp. tritici]|uniref:Uncharacterized protein n=1 Tax=Puccinia graminis f. sp. tritici TaxID=56615 RepID=A0A5B0P9D2_PUCGR|nr:hypothetical protein PGT21_025566 [Puccinia graminis f. sp. tritici]